MRECVEKVNADLAADERLAGSQISRFLVLHKELDADDGELTRTRKVRRGFIAERYQLLVDALYGGRSEQFVETAVRFEDGRTGKVAATLKIVDVPTFARRAARRRDGRRAEAGDVILDVRNISLRFGGVKALSDITLRRPRARDPRHHRPERRRQELDAQLHQRRLPAAGRLDQPARQDASAR